MRTGTKRPRKGRAEGPAESPRPRRRQPRTASQPADAAQTPHGTRAGGPLTARPVDEGSARLADDQDADADEHSSRQQPPPPDTTPLLRAKLRRSIPCHTVPKRPTPSTCGSNAQERHTDLRRLHPRGDTSDPSRTPRTCHLHA